MSDLTWAVLWLLVGVVLGAVAVWLARRALAGRDHAQDRDDAAAGDAETLRPGAQDVLGALRSITVVVNASDRVVRCSPAAQALGLVRGAELMHHELRYLVRQVRRDHVVREVEMELPRGPLGRGRLTLGVRVAALHGDLVLVLVEDRTHSRRVEETRRDFVVNVSHELKTPVGGLSLLAEAVEGAKDDPEAVERFAMRMQIETQRLSTLVREIVQLSRLQVADTLHEPVLVDVTQSVAEALDHLRVVAEDRDIELVTATSGEGPLVVYGDGELLTTAVRNLVANAVNYSEAGTRVVTVVSRVDELVEIAVTDQGPGIPAAEQERIFERFYRVDPARSRETGGTGLGLAIVKHICVNHGGEVTVWSEEGQGSTFTMRLPAADAASVEPAQDAGAGPRADPVTEAAPGPDVVDDGAGTVDHHVRPREHPPAAPRGRTHA
ncbi:sensor histidine kinase [Luteipulveratus flavus]|uniref:Sensor-like histidine kinase SenX3 n=1 Tax=Luteipulveratus flavus TaxID=3031728 RepID=A0ABT6CAJ7_9MICO|nr:ATP-binding protein [Luteipulveratus sp. YIM 133296]MDF8265543.1 ATP-binding protein [Luteipulveratus sp. YIM 133296]